MLRKSSLEKLATAITSIQIDHPTLVAIDGVDGSGKTTLADELVALTQKTGRNVIRASIDGFHNPRIVRYTRGKDSAEGYYLDSFNYGALRQELLEPLGPGGDGKIRTSIFNYRTDQPSETPVQATTRDAVLLFDGVFLQRPELDGLWNLTIWVDAPFELTVERAISRDARDGSDIEVIRRKYEQRYVPGQKLYLEQCRPNERADIFFDNSNFEHPTMRFNHRD